MNARYSLYQTITNDMLAELKRGVAPWVRPWESGGSALPLLPYNALTRKPYHGVTVLILWHAALLKGYRSPAWIGFHQAQELGGHVKKDEKSTVIVYGSTFAPKEERGKPEEEQKRVPFLKKRIVFNVEQTPGLPECHFSNSTSADRQRGFQQGVLGPAPFSTATGDRVWRARYSVAW